MTKQESENDLEAASVVPKQRCDNHRVSGPRLCRYYIASINNRICRYTYTGTCKVIEKYRKGQEDE